MLFSSPRFFLFVAVLLCLLALPIRNGRKLHILALGSCFFYAAWDVRYLALLLLISVIDYVCAAHIAASNDERKRRALVLVSIVTNLSILGYFKYANFFVDNLNAVLALRGIRIQKLDILLPAGISFYTFKTMSYTIDVYRRRISPVRTLLDYTMFVTFFPELIAGPIVRASVFLPQLSRPLGPNRERLAHGASLFILGLTKKVVLADRFAVVSDAVFAQPTQYSSLTVWLGVLAYALQIYCDFSGYSDMAIGTAKMFGYDLPENFDMPYLSGDITDFWRRWHMTLSAWLRDYLYIPLGGNRGGATRTYVNLMVTMLLGGLWHGASWNFVAWGALHGGALAVHRMWKRHTRLRVPRALATAGTFLFVMLCWVPFRAPNVSVCYDIFRHLFAPHDGVRWIPSPMFWCGTVLLVGHVVGALVCRMNPNSREAAALSAWGIERIEDSISGIYVRLHISSLPGATLVSLWLLVIFFFASTATSPFIYFQF